MHGCERVDLDIDGSEAVKNDLEHFIHARVKELTRVDGFGHELQDYGKTTLLERTEGTFLWAGFALMELSRHTTCTELLNSLERIPRGLSAVYSQTILRIPEDHSENSFRILRWVILARESLSLKQLAAATGLVAIRSGMHEEQSIRDGIALCGPFLKLQNPRSAWFMRQRVITFYEKSPTSTQF
jgi:hypothetical protein